MDTKKIVSTVVKAIKAFDAGFAKVKTVLLAVIKAELEPIADEAHKAEFAEVSKAIRAEMVEKLAYTEDSARTTLARHMRDAGVKSPNARGKQATEKAELTDWSEKALVMAFRKADWTLCNRIVAKARAEAKNAKSEEPAA